MFIFQPKPAPKKKATTTKEDGDANKEDTKDKKSTKEDNTKDNTKKTKPTAEDEDDEQ